MPVRKSNNKLKSHGDIASAKWYKHSWEMMLFYSASRQHSGLFCTGIADKDCMRVVKVHILIEIKEKNSGMAIMQATKPYCN